jgi:hypothetical protein
VRSHPATCVIVSPETFVTRCPLRPPAKLRNTRFPQSPTILVRPGEKIVAHISADKRGIMGFSFHNCANTDRAVMMRAEKNFLHDVCTSLWDVLRRRGEVSAMTIHPRRRDSIYRNHVALIITARKQPREVFWRGCDGAKRSCLAR